MKGLNFIPLFKIYASQSTFIIFQIFLKLFFNFLLEWILFLKAVTSLLFLSLEASRKFHTPHLLWALAALCTHVLFVSEMCIFILEQSQVVRGLTVWTMQWNRQCNSSKASSGTNTDMPFSQKATGEDLSSRLTSADFFPPFLTLSFIGLWGHYPGSIMWFHYEVCHSEAQLKS